MWVGNIEIHINSSDWYKHGHHKDKSYNNIVLHVVYNHDIDNKDTLLSKIPTLEIRNLFNNKLYYKYQDYLISKNTIPCQNDIGKTSSILLMSWLNRLLVERLEHKTKEMLHYHIYFHKHWQDTLYFFISKNFGFKKNSTGFEMLAKSLPYKILSKHRGQIFQLEALLFGQAGLLKNNYSDIYPQKLYKEYSFLRKKYNLTPIKQTLWKFSKLRPPNFPTIRIAQFAQLINKSESLWELMIKSKKVNTIKDALQVTASDYWDNHYTFDKKTSLKKKNLGDSCIENIIINTISPIIFLYGKQTSGTSLCEKSIELLSILKPENNHIISTWERANIKPQNASDTQALIELKKNYCVPKRCLQCSIGNALLKGV